MPARLTRVAISDYRSIGTCDVSLHPLTLLIGPNGAGKTNFLDALRFVADCMHGPLEQAVEARSGIRSILRKLPGGRSAPRFQLQLTFELGDCREGIYSLTVQEGEDASALIEEEKWDDGFTWRANRLSGTVIHNTGDTPAFTDDRPILIAFGGRPQFAPVFELLSGLTFYAPSPKRMRRPAPIGPGRVLLRDGTNAADVLARPQRENASAAERLQDYFRSLHPEACGNRRIDFRKPQPARISSAAA